jgi:hypothetical protein
MDNHYVDAEQIEFLVNAVPGLANQGDKVVFYITYILFEIASGRGVEHCYESDCSYISYNVLRRIFPKNTGEFRQLNDKTGLFIISNNWYARRGHGKTYKVSKKGLKIVADFNRMKAAQLETKPKTWMIDLEGVLVRKPRVAIYPLDRYGIRRTSKGQLRSSTLTIDTGGVIGLLAEIDEDLHQPGNPCRFDRGCLQNCSLPNLRNGEMIHTYHEARSGRQVGNGFHLQTVRREIREAALGNHYDYDISNCHYTLLHQLGMLYGCKMDSIAYYLANKTRFRVELAREYGLSEYGIKKILVSLIYGACLSTSKYQSIGAEVINVDGQSFINNFEIQGIASEIKGATHAILKNAVVVDGLLINAMDKTCPITEKPVTQIAHLLHGLESLAMDCAIGEQDGDITLLCFDGFVTREKIDTRRIENTFYAQTGMEIEYEENRIKRHHRSINNVNKT